MSILKRDKALKDPIFRALRGLTEGLFDPKISL